MPLVVEASLYAGYLLLGRRCGDVGAGVYAAATVTCRQSNSNASSSGLIGVCPGGRPYPYARAYGDAPSDPYGDGHKSSSNFNASAHGFTSTCPSGRPCPRVHAYGDAPSDPGGDGHKSTCPNGYVDCYADADAWTCSHADVYCDTDADLSSAFCSRACRRSHPPAQGPDSGLPDQAHGPGQRDKDGLDDGLLRRQQPQGPRDIR